MAGSHYARELTGVEKREEQGNERERGNGRSGGKTKTDGDGRGTGKNCSLPSTPATSSHQPPFFLSSREFNPRMKAANTCSISSLWLDTSFLRCIVSLYRFRCWSMIFWSFLNQVYIVFFSNNNNNVNLLIIRAYEQNWLSFQSKSFEESLDTSLLESWIFERR